MKQRLFRAAERKEQNRMIQGSVDSSERKSRRAAGFIFLGHTCSMMFFPFIPRSKDVRVTNGDGSQTRHIYEAERKNQNL